MDVCQDNGGPRRTKMKNRMYSEAGIKQLRAKIARGMNCSHLNGWEQVYLQSMDDLLGSILTKPGHRARMLSNSQERRLMEIFAKANIPYWPPQTAPMNAQDLLRKSPKRNDDDDGGVMGFMLVAIWK
jgi:hypothetical protein